MKLKELLVAFAVIYLSACAFYLFVTQNIGTPFKDAVKQNPQLQAIKDESVKIRKRHFTNGILFGILVYIALKDRI